MAALFPFNSGDLCGGSTASLARDRATECSLRWPGSPTRYNAIALVVLTIDRDVGLANRWPYAFPLTWIFLGLATLWCLLRIFSARFRISRLGARVRHVWRACSPHIFASRQTAAFQNTIFLKTCLNHSPLDPSRLYLSIYPWMELSYCVETNHSRSAKLLRPGNTSMWAGLHFINGYSPIRAAGVAREFATTTHGEINPTMGESLLNYQAGPDGELALLGVDGIVVARELDFSPQPESEWELVVSSRRRKRLPSARRAIGTCALGHFN